MGDNPLPKACGLSTNLGNTITYNINFLLTMGSTTVEAQGRCDVAFHRTLAETGQSNTLVKGSVYL